MTFEQIIRELRACPPRDLDEWMALRHAQILGLPDTQKECVEEATMRLRKWLKDVAVMTQAANV